jgi:hypothetical protein
MPLDDLLGICPPPLAPKRNTDHDAVAEVARKYGLRYPRDYAEFCWRYGNGGFIASNSHEIRIYNALSRAYDTLVKHALDVINWIFHDPPMAEWLRTHRISGAQLFPLGHDTGESYLDWVTDPDPDKWRVLVVGWETRRIALYDLGLSEFLVAYFTGKLDVPTWQNGRVHGQVPKYSFVQPE